MEPMYHLHLQIFVSKCQRFQNHLLSFSHPSVESTPYLTLPIPTRNVLIPSSRSTLQEAVERGHVHGNAACKRTYRRDLLQNSPLSLSLSRAREHRDSHCWRLALERPASKLHSNPPWFEPPSLLHRFLQQPTPPPLASHPRRTHLPGQ